MVAAVVVSIVELVEPPPGGPKILDRSPMPGREIPGLCDSVQLCAQNASENGGNSQTEHYGDRAVSRKV